MTSGKLNIIFGLVIVFIAALGGLALGRTFDDNAVREGEHILELARFYLRGGHTHGMFIAFLNLFIGILMTRLSLSDLLKKVCSIAAILSVFLPIALAAKGAAGAPDDFPHFGIIGILGFLIAVGIAIYGALKLKTG